MKYIFMAIMIVGLSGCGLLPSSNGTPDQEKVGFIRVSKGEFGAKILGIGLGAQGDYCQFTISDPDYEWTTEDLEFWKGHCPPDTERERILKTLE